MKISFYGTDEESYNNTMKRLDFKVTLAEHQGLLADSEGHEEPQPRG